VRAARTLGASVGVPHSCRASSRIYVQWLSGNWGSEPPQTLMLFFANSLINQMVPWMGFVYAFQALHNERRDRSSLLWKSLPISDAITVLSKVAILMIVFPLIHFGSLALVHLVLAGLVPIAAALGTQATLYPLPAAPLTNWIMGAGYLAATGMLWLIPICAWFMLMGAWGGKANMTLAILPFVAAIALERGLSDTSQVVLEGIMGRIHRPEGRMEDDSNLATRDYRWPVYEWDTAMSLGDPQLWLGLVIAAALIAITIKLRSRSSLL
jgi:ABC-2 type transport system permease protein